ncbi:hypothetical protein JNK13_07965 [bacterium]|nr:hypothetical protein [bacterium]
MKHAFQLKTLVFAVLFVLGTLSFAQDTTTMRYKQWQESQRRFSTAESPTSTQRHNVLTSSQVEATSMTWREYRVLRASSNTTNHQTGHKEAPTEANTTAGFLDTGPTYASIEPPQVFARQDPPKEPLKASDFVREGVMPRSQRSRLELTAGPKASTAVIVKELGANTALKVAVANFRDTEQSARERSFTSALIDMRFGEEERGAAFTAGIGSQDGLTYALGSARAYWLESLGRDLSIQAETGLYYLPYRSYFFPSGDDPRLTQDWYLPKGAKPELSAATQLSVKHSSRINAGATLVSEFNPTKHILERAYLSYDPHLVLLADPGTERTGRFKAREIWLNPSFGISTIASEAFPTTGTSRDQLTGLEAGMGAHLIWGPLLADLDVQVFSPFDRKINPQLSLGGKISYRINDKTTAVVGYQQGSGQFLNWKDSSSVAFPFHSGSGTWYAGIRIKL